MSLSDIIFYAETAAGLLFVPILMGLCAVRMDRRERAERMALARPRARAA